MIHKFKECCEICGKYVNDYDTSTGKIICKKCSKKSNKKKELNDPVQLDINDLLYGTGNCKKTLGIDLKEGYQNEK